VYAQNVDFTGIKKYLSPKIWLKLYKFRRLKRMDELFERLKKLITENLEIDEDKITMDASFRQDLGADSLETYELVYAIEEELGIRIPDEKANEFETVRDSFEYIKSQVPAK
jgi:acyl carrier protein